MPSPLSPAVVAAAAGIAAATPPDTPRVTALNETLERETAAAEVLLKKQAESKEALTEDEQTALANHLDTAEAAKGELLAYGRVAALRHQPEAPRRLFDASARPLMGTEDDVAMRQGGYASIASFANDVRKAALGQGTSDKLGDWMNAAATTFGQESVGADGGFAVPPAFAAEIWSLVFDEPDIISAFNLAPTGSSNVVIPVEAQTPWGSNGILAYWENEAAVGTQRKPKMQQKNVPIHKVMALVPATDELLQDAPRMRDLLTSKAAAAIRWKVADALINGDGVGKPRGVLTSGSKIEIAKESGQANDTIVAENVVKMFARLLGRQGSFWAHSPDALAMLPLLKVGDQAMWQIPSAGGLQVAPTGALMGRPLVESEACNELGLVGDLIHISPQGYAGFVRTGGIESAESMHLWFDQGVNAFRWTFRVGGDCYLDSAVARAKGSLTRSHVVTIAAR